jgi:hypothetical protein
MIFGGWLEHTPRGQEGEEKGPKQPSLPAGLRQEEASEPEPTADGQSH